MCEPCLWTQWVHLGIMQSVNNATLAIINCRQFAIDCREDAEMHAFVLSYAKLYIERLNAMSLRTLSDWFSPAFVEYLCFQAQDREMALQVEQGVKIDNAHGVGLGTLINVLQGGRKHKRKPKTPQELQGLRRKSTPSDELALSEPEGIVPEPSLLFGALKSTASTKSTKSTKSVRIDA